MNKPNMANLSSQKNWFRAKSVKELEQQKVSLIRIEGKQIALFNSEKGIFACNNKCPHEGYPLTEGNLSGSCILTCNWHNWKFDLNTGQNLIGGDSLRTYPIEIRGDEVWIDISDPPYVERYTAIINNLKDAFEDHSYDRLAREIARFQQIGADPLEILRLAIQWSWNRMEFGWTHAYAGMADWLQLYQENDHPEIQLTCLLESVAHTSFDVLREQEYPFSEKSLPFNETEFLNAIEQEDEITAVSHIRGGLLDGMAFTDFERALSHAALAHYNDFGHSLIYVTKAKFLIEKLGSQVAESLLLSLVRQIIFATREDKIPEFRRYSSSLESWGSGESSIPTSDLWRNKGINSSLSMVVDHDDQNPQEVYTALLLANAINLLSFDIEQEGKHHVTVSGNVGWLDFTHGLTFSNAVRTQCLLFPELWPQGLLQMACFSGRNAAFTTSQYDLETWKPQHSPQQAVQEIMKEVLDHGQPEYIVSVHWLKTTLAVREEIQQLSDQQSTILVAALNRFIHSPIKRRHTLRTAYQSIKFVESE